MTLAETTTLCIIDCQAEFPATERIVEEVIEEINYAMKNNMGIVVIKYQDYGPTHPQIIKALGRYPRKTSVTKKEDGGGNEFLYAAKKKGLPTQEVRIVGVNRGYCVRDTVCDLLDSFSVKKIHIVEEATWSCTDPEEELKMLRRIADQCGKVKIV